MFAPGRDLTIRAAPAKIFVVSPSALTFDVIDWIPLLT